jgi:hypothetical protein
LLEDWVMAEQGLEAPSMDFIPTRYRRFSSLLFRVGSKQRLDSNTHRSGKDRSLRDDFLHATPIGFWLQQLLR